MTDDMRRFMRKHFGGGDFNDLPFVKSIIEEERKRILDVLTDDEFVRHLADNWTYGQIKTQITKKICEK